MNFEVLVSTDSGDNWNIAKSFNGFYVENVTTSVNKNYILLFALNGLYISSDFGNNWEIITLEYLSPGFKQYTAILSSNDMAIFAGEGSLFISNNYGLNWQFADSGPEYTLTTCIAKEGDDIAVGSWNGLLLSTDNGISWNNISNLNSSVLSVAILNNILFVGTELKGLLISSDLGISWTAPSEFSNIEISSITVANDYIIVASSKGVYYTYKTNLNNWKSINEGLNDAKIEKLSVAANTLFASSFGNGVYKLDLSLLDVEDVNQNNSISIYPNPAQDYIIINNSGNYSSPTFIRIINQIGNILFEKEFIGNSYQVDLKNFPSGVYTCIINNGNVIKKFIKIRN